MNYEVYFLLPIHPFLGLRFQLVVHQQLLSGLYL